jgi:hypothetical protein
MMCCKCKAGRGWRCMVEEVLDYVEEWKRRAKAFEAGPKIILLAALLTRLFTTLVALAWLARMSHFGDERRLMRTKQIPSRKTNGRPLLDDDWSAVESITSFSPCCGWQSVLCIEGHRIESFTLGRAELPAAAPNLPACSATRQPHSNRLSRELTAAN